jgi:hypothetical protein
MQAPLSYNTAYPYAEFDYAAAARVLAGANRLFVIQESNLILTQDKPSAYSMLDSIPNLEWTALVPKGLTVGSVATRWPGDVASPIAMIDTGGGPVFLSDPSGYVYTSTWPHPTSCPTWTASSELCTCVSDDLGLELAGASGAASYKYAIRTGDLPTPAQGLTLVMCKRNAYMMDQQGLNIGGISALFNRILIDYRNGQVGFRPK